MFRKKSPTQELIFMLWHGCNEVHVETTLEKESEWELVMHAG
jgi:hypothetical protein